MFFRFCWHLCFLPCSLASEILNSSDMDSSHQQQQAHMCSSTKLRLVADLCTFSPRHTTHTSHTSRDFEMDEDGLTPADTHWHDKKVGSEWEIVVILRQEPPCYVSYPNRGKLTWYIYFFAHVSITSFARIIRPFLMYLLTFCGSYDPYISE